MSDVHDEHEHEERIEEPEYRGERLQRVMAQRGAGSRRKSEELITAGQVRVNGDVVTELGTRVDPMRDEIRVAGKVLRRQAPRYLMLNKPTGFITTVSDERDRWTVMDLVKVPERVYPVGRLDRGTQGLVLMTNDGDLAHRIMHPSYRVEKEYQVFTGTRPSETQLQRLRDGLRIDGHMVRPHEVRLFRESTEGVAILVTIHEGLYHVVRRMMDMVGIEIDRLRRTRLGPLHSMGIPVGAWRDLTPGELVQLYRSVGLQDVDAERANGQRPMQLTPVGGFSHLASTPSAPRGGNRAPSENTGRRGSRDDSRGRADRPPRRGEQRSDRPPRRGPAGAGPTRPRSGRDDRTDDRRGGDDRRTTGERPERRDAPPQRFDREVRRDDDRDARRHGPPGRQFDVKDPSRAIEDGFADRRQERDDSRRRDRGAAAPRERAPYRRAGGDGRRDGERLERRRPPGERTAERPQRGDRRDGAQGRFENSERGGSSERFERRERGDGPPGRFETSQRGGSPERFERRDRDDRSERGPRRFEESDRQGHVRFQPRNSPAGRPRRDDRDGQRGADNRFERRDRSSGPPRDHGRHTGVARPDGDDRRPTGDRFDQRRAAPSSRPAGDRFERRDGPSQGRGGPTRAGGTRDAGSRRGSARGGNRDDRSRPSPGDRDRRPGRRR